MTHLNQPRALTPADRSAATSPTAEARKTHRRECESLDIISQKVNRNWVSGVGYRPYLSTIDRSTIDRSTIDRSTIDRSTKHRSIVDRSIEHRKRVSCPPGLHRPSARAHSGWVSPL